MGSETLPEIIVCEHSPQMQVKTLSCKEEAICEHDPRTELSGPKAHLKWTEAQWETVFHTRFIQFRVVVRLESIPPATG